jgi:RecG-like helicase
MCVACVSFSVFVVGPLYLFWHNCIILEGRVCLWLVQAQQQSLEDFRQGTLNTLVCTSVAEEGLDLTACRLVLRFDPPGRPLAFIQSRGRARAVDSYMIVMVEEGNEYHMTLLEDVRLCAP